MQQALLLLPHAGLVAAAPLRARSQLQHRPRGNLLNLLQAHSSSPRQFTTSSIQFKNSNVSSIKAQAQYGTKEASGFGSSYTTTVDAAEINMRNLVAKRLEETARHFKTMGSLGFWSQFLCTLVSAAILAFSIFVSGTATATVTKYLTAAGIAVGFISVFRSFGYIRLSGRLESAMNDPSKAPPRTEVIDKLKTGIIVNVLGLASTVVGLQATVGLLVAKALNSPATPFLQGPYAGQSPVLALDVFLVQACANALLSHFLGLVFNLELLRSVSDKPPPPQKVTVQAAT
ncbi:protein TIC 21, chloroplastic [Selaginella moellendorffii]|uniref:protein TIC 21, chloroplastic n=1 Tax=Selaginella moellendorffii TaxID=88036 RepID=UPI000D1C9DD4|nr:protein TIC 21, chloroplastic [Selaginella moellendorffii]|eukprot:XP_002974116.2 protein TIC 21, chloroplastic [Selaginella moellendorffii]